MNHRIFQLIDRINAVILITATGTVVAFVRKMAANAVHGKRTDIASGV